MIAQQAAHTAVSHEGTEDLYPTLNKRRNARILLEEYRKLAKVANLDECHST